MPPPDGVVAPNGFQFDRLGVRIPTVIVSPWVKKGTIINKPNGPSSTSQWEGASPLATANNLFGIEDAISERAAWSATFDYLFTEMEEPRDDAVRFAPAKEFTAEDVASQWVKPINEHMEIQVKFYCEQLDIKPCPEFRFQGDASEFILRNVPRYMEMIQNRE